MNVDAVIGEAVHTLMWRQGITQAAMAAALDLDQSALSRKLHGSRPWKASEVMAAADFLSVTPGELYPMRQAVAVGAEAPVGNGDSLRFTWYANSAEMTLGSAIGTESCPNSPRLVRAA